MNLRKYYNYFKTIFSKWGLKIGLFSIFTEIKGEIKYGIDSTAYYEVDELDVDSGNKMLSNVYQPANYYLLEKALKFMKIISQQGKLVDFGCGMGRILAVAARFGFRDLMGIEFSPNLCHAAERNMVKVRRKFPEVTAKIICTNAMDYEIDKNDTIFTFFNPFKEEVLIKVIKNIRTSLKNHPRKVYVIYITPVDEEIFLSSGFERLRYYRKMDYLDFSVLYWTPEMDF